MMKKVLLIGLVVVLSTAALATMRLMRTAEGIVYWGSPQERVDICRTIPKLAKARQERLLRRLLADPSLDVRASAITAIASSAVLESLVEDLRRLAGDPSAAVSVRAKAITTLLELEPADAWILTYMDEQRADVDFRAMFAGPIAQHHELALPSLDHAALEALLDAALAPADPAQRALADMLRNHLAMVTPFRDRFVAALVDEENTSVRRFALAALQHIDGQMRGERAEDWELNTLYTCEAEWASEIRPNYMIGQFKGERCIALGEGAGGILHWLKAENGTVDVGRARLSLFVPQDGQYVPWARIYFDDKCGNSFGFAIGGRHYGGRAFSDRKAPLDQWHWTQLYPEKGSPEDTFAAGFHAATITAWEDAVYLDEFALLPPGTKPTDFANRGRMRWDPSMLPGLSFSPQWQAQPLGTTQEVQIWIRRQNPKEQSGLLTVTAPPGFATTDQEIRIRFVDNDPLAMATIRLELPADARVGEGELSARYRDDNGTEITGGMILGAQFDWWTTGPVASDGDLPVELKQATAGANAIFSEPTWKRYPVAGYDPYRRLDFEQAWGPLEGKAIYLTCEIEVAQTGDYVALLTADDWARVYLDGVELVRQANAGPGEGRLVQQPVTITKGRHRLFVHQHQSDKPDPSGEHAGRGSYNNCNFKLLLRRERHVHAPGIHGLPRQ